MRVLVIGGAGYIGSHVVKALLNDSQEVRVFDDLSTGTKDNLFEKAQFIEGSILDQSKLAQAMKDMDAVIFLAAKKAVGESMVDPDKYSDNNVIGALNVLKEMRAQGVKKFIFSSSAAVYGMPEKTEIDENTPTNPINWYGMTKLIMEEMLKGYDMTSGIKHVALRYFNAVGYDEEGDITGLEMNPQNLLPIIMETVIGMRQEMSVYGTDYPTPDGSCIRDYIHVTDLASAHVKALHYLEKENKSNVFNLGTGKGLSVLEMIEAAQKVTGKKVNFKLADRRAGDPAKLIAVPQKADEVLDWRATHSDVNNIIASTYKVYQEKILKK